MNEEAKYLFDNVKELNNDEEEIETVELAGYQVTRPELFSHSREPAITVWHDRIKFNMACLRKFPGVTHIQLLIHPDQKRIIIRPCEKDAPESLRWCSGGGEKEIKNRDMVCKLFSAMLFELMDWNKAYKYKMLGKPATCKGEVLFLFRLSDFEMFVNDGKTKKPRAYLPGDWRDYFGSPVETLEDSYKVDPADGYILTTAR